MSELTAVVLGNGLIFCKSIRIYRGIEDIIIHIADIGERKTLCGRKIFFEHRAIRTEIDLSAEANLTCPDCTDELRFRSRHPEYSARPIGEVTHVSLEARAGRAA